MNLLVYILNIFGRIRKKVVKKQQWVWGEKLGDWGQRLFIVLPFILFTFYVNEGITYSEKVKSERKLNLKGASVLDTRFTKVDHFAFAKLVKVL